MFLTQTSSRPPQWLSWIAVPVTALSLLTFGLPMAPATANDYGKCVEELSDAGVSEANAANACSGALHPTDVSGCVRRINNESSVGGAETLFACTRVRRPLDLAYCVNTLMDDRDGVEATSILEGCRRSLLPKRYAECVTGLTGNVEAAAIGGVLQTCLDPQDLLSER